MQVENGIGLFISKMKKRAISNIAILLFLKRPQGVRGFSINRIQKD